MTSPHPIDLGQPTFWCVAAGAVVVMSLATRAAPRRIVWAVINLVFIGLVCRWQAAYVFAGLALLFLLLRGVTRPRLRLGLLTAGSVTLVALFVLHKLPDLAARLHLRPLSSIATAIGFSYVALRVVELLRAVAEGRHRPPSWCALVNYLVPFHMLAAGPIQAYDDFVAQLDQPPPLKPLQVLRAFERIAHGVFKKFVLAYVIDRTFLNGFAEVGAYTFVEVQFFFLWLYLDFSAYSDIAVGVGSLLGVATPENFRRPYLARNLIDFWDRWHISLSQFVRRNLFIPIQMGLLRRTDGRHSLACASAAFFVAFVLCGLWHGLNVNFLLWGSIHAAGLVVVNLYRYWLQRRLGSAGVKAYLARPGIRIAATVMTYEFVAFSLLSLFFPR